MGRVPFSSVVFRLMGPTVLLCAPPDVPFDCALGCPPHITQALPPWAPGQFTVLWLCGSQGNTVKLNPAASPMNWVPIKANTMPRITAAAIPALRLADISQF